MATIHLVRHGQASFAGDDYDRLSELGHRQGALLGARFAASPGLRLVTGTMRRHRETAAAFAGAAGLADAPEPVPGWNEFDYVDVIGRHRPDLGDHAALRRWAEGEPEPVRAFQSLYQAAIARWVEHGDEQAGYRESYDGFCRRVSGALTELVDHRRNEGDVMVFTSGGPIGVVAGMLLGVPPHLRRRIDRAIVNTGVTRIVVRSGRPQLSTFNGHDHLGHDDALVTYR